MVVKHLLLIAFAAAPLHAFAEQRFLAEDVPRAELLPVQQQATQPDLGLQSSKDLQVPVHVHLGLTFLGGVVGSLGGTYLGVGLGGLSNTLIGAAVPVLLSNLFVAPFVTVLTAWLVGNGASLTRYQFWIPWTVSFILHAATYVAASFIGVSWMEPVAMFLYTTIDALLLSGSAVAVMQLLAAKRPQSTIRSFVPTTTDTQVANLFTHHF